jgi:DNA-directed RNA polymerase subunit RPC12/RpoP
MTKEEFDFDQDLMTIQCPKCSTIGDSRELKTEDSVASGEVTATEFVCANCNLTF